MICVTWPGIIIFFINSTLIFLMRNFRVKYQESCIVFEILANLQSIEIKCKKVDFLKNTSSFSFFSLFLFLLVPWTKNHLSSFKCGFLNIFSRQTCCVVCQGYCFYYGGTNMARKNVWKTTFHSTFWGDSTLANQGAGKTIEKPLKELPWNQQVPEPRIWEKSVLTFLGKLWRHRQFWITG